ncbi:sigma-54 dependent transcriptional regulator [Desulfuromonas sp. TF]|uniref:sigma-54-dependent transcriptional regulator n=1 Tax=Desulfuromonas sp. TF TaxID=1232410 RepID=UPI000405AFAE|nr:sigma-54 dependent transcriptional regulator [Desulfuromonas sp. TF]
MTKTDTAKVLVVDDESPMRHMLRLVLEKGGYRVYEAADGETALGLMEQEPFGLILCDIRMPGMDGLSFIREFTKRQSPATLIMMSAYGTLDTAIECMKLGAYDYISKPFKPDEVILTLKKAEERLGLRRENALLKEELARSGAIKGIEAIVFRSDAMKEILALVRRLADSSSSVLITGETGTGKELIARALHAEGNRRKKPFFAVNCSAITASLMESELFGHARGAFTGAEQEQQGLFGAADGGVMFLDEIGELPLELQPKLLRVLQEGEVRRVGETRPRKIDVRMLAATARDLREEVDHGRFREDLYYRLNVVELHLPSLRDRREDIAPLAEHFLRKIATREKRSVPSLAPDALEILRSYHWPGNIRELENFLEKTLIFCRDAVIESSALPWEVRRREREANGEYSLKQASMRLEREYIRKALSVTGGNRTQAARLLEVSLRALLYKMKEYGIE